MVTVDDTVSVEGMKSRTLLRDLVGWLDPDVTVPVRLPIWLATSFTIDGYSLRLGRVSNGLCYVCVASEFMSRVTKKGLLKNVCSYDELSGKIL